MGIFIIRTKIALRQKEKRISLEHVFSILLKNHVNQLVEFIYFIFLLAYFLLFIQY